MNQRKRLATLAVAAVAAIGLILFALGSSQRSASAGSPAGGPPGANKGKGGAFGASQAPSAKTVRAKAAVIATLRPYIDQGGDVETSVSMSVYPDIGGKLADVKVSVGDSVAKGEAIASVDPSKPGSSYAISAVESPISGTVTALLANPGESVSTATAVAKVGAIDDLQIVVNIPERDSAKVKKGMSANLSLEALPGEVLRATVSRVSPVLDATSRTREAVLKLDRKDDRVAAGMYASVRIFTSPLADRIVVPAAAVVARDDESFVYLVAEASGKKVAKMTAIKPGSSVDDAIEVKEGLRAGDVVVYEGQDLLSDGAELSVVGEVAE